ncbi:unnamed protein product, partial [Soboliphyme baturini]|uniref:DUF971 domain-containing protein n=1 Tax=Soboliphyme baturini TaxID=241478 RepID=A0A183IIN2_9BILA
MYDRPADNAFVRCSCWNCSESIVEKDARKLRLSQIFANNLSEHPLLFAVSYGQLTS